MQSDRPSDRVVSTADARAAFLNDEPVGDTVRQPILASWARSRALHVAPDRIELGRESASYRDAPLRELAGPIVDDVTDVMAGEPVSVILCDDLGVVLERRTGDTALRRHLDKVWLAPGFSYSESQVGTNGIGTALESRGPAHVFGAEHWADGLADLACAATPVRHPVTNRVVGVVNLTCWRQDAGRLLVTTTELIARQVTQGLRDHVGRHEATVLDDFLAACRRTRAAVLAISDGIVMLNDRAREVLDAADQERLVAAASEAFASGRPGRLVVDLPSGTTARLDCRPSWSDGGAGGGVVVVQAGRRLPRPAARSRTMLPVTQAGPAALVGSGTLWTMCRHAVDRHFQAREWLVLQGEPGSGRRALARASHQLYSPAAHVRVLTAAQAPSDGGGWLDEVAAELRHRSATLVLADVDRLQATLARRLMDALEPHRWSTRPDRPWLVVTVGRGPLAPEVARLVERFTATVEVPPLRYHSEDVPDLVRHLLGRLGHRRLTCSPEALRVLSRCRWPGNVEQLHRVLTAVVAHRRSGVIEVADLPADVHADIRRLLTPLEAIECDAIVAALRQAGGSKSRAAALLGMSRATIYRKVREYGLTLPAVTVDSTGPDDGQPG